MAFVEDLAPKDILKFVPDYLVDETVHPMVIPALAPYLRDQNVDLRKTAGFLAGAVEHQEIVTRDKKEVEDKTKSTSARFNTSEVQEVRVFFRASNNNPDRPIGSKVRLYSLGKPYRSKSDKEEIQHIDSGFLRFNLGSAESSMVFQNALASTMFYRGLYCLGGPANIRKISVPGDGENDASYKWMSAISPKFSDNIDRHSFNHILHPALDLAGVDREFFAEETLDDLIDVFLKSKDIKDMETRLVNLAGEELDREFVMDLIAHSNTRDANLDNASSNDFDSSPGLSVVRTLRYLADHLESDEDDFED